MNQEVGENNKPMHIAKEIASALLALVVWCFFAFVVGITAIGLTVAIFVQIMGVLV